MVNSRQRKKRLLKQKLTLKRNNKVNEVVKERVQEHKKQRLQRESLKDHQNMTKHVNIKAFDLWGIGGLGFKPRKGDFVDHVIIRTDVKLPNNVWRRVVELLEKETVKHILQNEVKEQKI